MDKTVPPLYEVNNALTIVKADVTSTEKAFRIKELQNLNV